MARPVNEQGLNENTMLANTNNATITGSTNGKHIRHLAGWACGQAKIHRQKRQCNCINMKYVFCQQMLPALSLLLALQRLHGNPTITITGTGPPKSSPSMALQSL
jgi:hypothetical protein